MFTLEWTAQECLTLIDLYRKRPILWDKTTIGHKNRQRKALAWLEIAQTMRCSKQEVERKLNVLLTQYRRERQKIMVRYHECPEDPYSPSWYAFKAFAFLEDVKNSGNFNKTQTQSSLLNVSTASNITQANGVSISLSENHSLIESPQNASTPVKQDSENQSVLSNATSENRPLPKVDLQTTQIIQNALAHNDKTLAHETTHQNEVSAPFIRRESLPFTKVFASPISIRTNFETKNMHISRSGRNAGKRKLPHKVGKERKELRNTLQKLIKKVMNEDECDYMGSNTIAKLRLMERSQRIIAEKLIGDVLFYGQLNKLTNSAEVILSKDKIGQND